jgi:predicted double-glycine peptidase
MVFPYYKQEKNYTCGAASMRMILEYFGTIKSEKEVAKLVGSSPNHGTWFKDFSKVAKKLKLDYVEKENGKISELKQLIKDGYKIIVCYLDLKDKEHDCVVDHYTVIKKIDENNIYLYDPWYGAKNKYTINYFRRIWKSRERPDKKDRWFIAIKK